MMNSHQPTARPAKQTRRGGTEEERPPAVRAEEAVLALDLVDVTQRVVGRVALEAPPGHPEVPGDHEPEQAAEDEADDADPLDADARSRTSRTRRSSPS